MSKRRFTAAQIASRAQARKQKAALRRIREGYKKALINLILDIEGFGEGL
jgi:hypothetical protein